MSFNHADWPLPDGVYAGWSDRAGGVSNAPFDSMNLGRHVGDDDQAVLKNREVLRSELPGTPSIHWLNQTHSTVVVDVNDADPTCGQDGSYTVEAGKACCVMTADCLPVFFWQQDGTRVAIAHAGWRGLADGVLLNTLDNFAESELVSCGIGPAISGSCFEVGQDVFSAFAGWPDRDAFFRSGEKPGKYYCDLSGLAASQLRRAGVREVFFSKLCSYQQADQFFSYRRDGKTGRMANLIWRNE